MGKLNQTTEQVQADLDQVEVTRNAAVMGENTSTGIVLDGLGTWVTVGNYSLAASSGAYVADGVAGTITLTGPDTPQAVEVNMFCGITETGGTKDWEFLLGWDVSGTTKQIDSQYINTNKSSTAKGSALITRGFAADDVITLKIASLLKAVTVDIDNSTLETFRRF